MVQLLLPVEPHGKTVKPNLVTVKPELAPLPTQTHTNSPTPPCWSGGIILRQQKRSRWSPSWSRPPDTWQDALSATPARPAGTPRLASCPGAVLGTLRRRCLQMEEAQIIYES